jgi:hypothetical protein
LRSVLPRRLRKPRDGHHKLREVKLLSVILVEFSQARLSLSLNRPDFRRNGKVQRFKEYVNVPVFKRVCRNILELAAPT